MNWLRSLAFTLLAAAFVPAGAQDADSPALWQVAGAKGKVYLFGSFHMLPPDVKWRSPAVDAALKQAQVIVLETDLAEARDPKKMQPLIQKYGMLPAGTTLSATLPEEMRPELERMTKELGLPPAAIEKLRPWFAAIALTATAMSQLGFDPKEGIENQLLAFAQAEGKTLGSLESNESQIRLMADLKPDAEAALLGATLKQLDELPGMLDDMLAAYRKGDTAGLEKTINAGLADVPALRERLLKGRHEHWLPQIEKMMKDGRNYTIVVGAAHLVGPDSVVALLRAKGIKVEGP